MKRLIVIRCGGFGDVIQAASILPGLKEEGWHITFDTSEQGFEILKSDPCIDSLLLTPHGSVSGENLGAYWNARTNGFNRIINLTGSVENTSLMTPNVFGFFHDDETRRRLYGDINYVEHAHRIANVPGPFAPRYCPYLAELDMTRGLSDGKRMVVLSLAGSAHYKVWPHAPAFVEKLLGQPETLVYLAGGPNDAHIAKDILAYLVEEQVPDLARVIDGTGEAVRTSYAIAWQADLVVGPETGIMNAVARSAGRKVVLLSHSSPTNLTKHWTNTVAISSRVPCHPCHRLHNTEKFCPRGPSGAFAACAESISPEQVLAASIGTTEDLI